MTEEQVLRKTVNVNGTGLSYLEAGTGSGTPLLLLHGTFWSRVWLPVLPALAAQGRCVAQQDQQEWQPGGAEGRRGAHCHTDDGGAVDDEVGADVPEPAPPGIFLPRPAAPEAAKRAVQTVSEPAQEPCSQGRKPPLGCGEACAAQAHYQVQAGQPVGGDPWPVHC